MPQSIPLIVFVALVSCGQEDSAREVTPPAAEEGQIYRVPVVVHVVHAPDNPASNISNAKIHSQLTALNRDYRARNADRARVPAEFQSLIADMGIEFVSASVAPDGSPSTGIVRHPVAQMYFPEDIIQGVPGLEPWPVDRYLNVWTLDIPLLNGRPVIAGRAFDEGVFIHYSTFGTEPPLTPGFELGRTATHEIGHWLGLGHLGSSVSECVDLDGLADTPVSDRPYFETPTYPQYSCGSSDMFMNFMSRVLDPSLLMFTPDQKAFARARLAPGGIHENVSAPAATEPLRKPNQGALLTTEASRTPTELSKEANQGALNATEAPRMATEGVLKYRQDDMKGSRFDLKTPEVSLEGTQVPTTHREPTMEGSAGSVDGKAALGAGGRGNPRTDRAFPDGCRGTEDTGRGTSGGEQAEGDDGRASSEAKAAIHDGSQPPRNG